jgi:hypothetical protein
MEDGETRRPFCWAGSSLAQEEGSGSFASTSFVSSQLAWAHEKAVGADLGPTAPHSGFRIDVFCRLRFDALAGVRSIEKGRDTSAMPRSLPHPWSRTIRKAHLGRSLR